MPEIIYGIRPVIEALRGRRRKVFEVLDASGNGEVAQAATAAGVPVKKVPHARVGELACGGVHQGVAARTETYPYVELEDLLATPDPLVVLLDGVTDPHNLGAILRTAECAGATGVVLPRHRSVHVTPTVAKAACGAIEHLPMAVVPGIPGALAELRRSGVWVVGLDPDGEQSLFDLAVATEPVTLVLGAEGRGLAPLARQRCDVVASIPVRGALASLNVAAAGALACYEVARRRLA